MMGDEPVRESEDKELEGGRVKEQLLVLLTQVSKARHFFRPAPQNVDGLDQKLVKLSNSGLLWRRAFLAAWHLELENINKQSVSSWILTSCQPHRVISGRWRTSRLQSGSL